MLKKMTKKQKKQFYKIVAAFVLLIVGVILPIPELYKLIFFIPGYLIVGYDVLVKAGKNITKGQVFDENFLMAIATIGAFALQEYTEGIAVMLFYQVGELFQSYAVNQSRKSVASLMDIRPDSAVVLRDGVEEEVFPDEVAVGETIIVKPGERIPLDGIVLEGSAVEYGVKDVAYLRTRRYSRLLHRMEKLCDDHKRFAGCAANCGRALLRRGQFPQGHIVSKIAACDDDMIGIWEQTR